MSHPAENRTLYATNQTSALSKDDLHASTVPRRWRTALAKAYYYATYPERQWYHRRLAAAGRAPISVLVFHRIADDGANSWTTPTRNFVEVIRWLKTRFEMISLTDLQQRLCDGSNTSPSACITFDDGYADNCETAIPLLIAEKIPCTYFVTAEPVLTGKPFAHDLEMGHTHLAPNTLDQLRTMKSDGIDIGAHTRTHPDIGRLADPARLYEEIVTSRNDLENSLGDRVAFFAFPFGSPENLTHQAFRLAKRAGFDGVCSAYGGWNYPADDPFHIRRRIVDGPPHRAKSWAVLDPLRELCLPHFAYCPERSPSLEQSL